MPRARVLVDGNRAPAFAVAATAVVGRRRRPGPAIAAASIPAPRPPWTWADGTEPGRVLGLARPGPARHKGYPSAEHLEALKRLGVTPLHRRSFGPVRALVAVADPDGVET
ncbi:MAG: hypothetical protein U5R48_12850 [Gammaproteobacteria bacterium]|nr:hypothetical protein [Gammaproteobacteria bacterium]